MIKVSDVIDIKMKPTARAIRAELERLGMTQVEMAEVLRVSARNMRRYVQDGETEGSVPMPFPTWALIKSMRL